MIKALLLIFEPAATWERIVSARRGWIYIFLVYLMPFLVLTSLAEGYGLMHWGKWQSDVVRLKKFSLNEAALFETGQLVLTLLVVFIGAKLVKSMGDTFRGRHTFTQAFTAIAYGLSPLFFFRLLDAFAITPWIGWSIGIFLSMGVLYQGVPRSMEPDPPHAFGLFLMTALTLFLATGLLCLVTAFYFQGKFGRFLALANG
jgi:hypothetical protein